MSVTIRDVAKRLNLSITTVSRALDGYDDVAEETRRLVEDTAQQMGYVPNQAARQLRRQRADTIGYILPADKPSFSDPFFAEFIAGLGDEASEYDTDLLVSNAAPGSLAELHAYQRWTHGHKVDGVLLNRIRLRDQRVQYLAEMQFPFVGKERSQDGHEYPTVEINGKKWFKVLVDHLIRLGHRSIAYIGASPELRMQADRLAGYHQAMSEAGLAILPDHVQQGDLSADGGYRAAQSLLALAKPPTAIACVDDMTAMGVLHAAHERGVKVGSDLAVAGFDGILGSEHTSPPLTTVNQPIYEIARKMAKILIQLIHGEVSSMETIYIEPILEIRQSTLGEGDGSGAGVEMDEKDLERK